MALEFVRNPECWRDGKVPRELEQECPICGSKDHLDGRCESENKYPSQYDGSK